MSEEKKTLKNMSEIMADFGKEKAKVAKQKKPPHELAAIVDEIEKVVGFKGIYGRGYWLRKAKGRSYTEILGILKEIGNADPKYNKGGMLTNKLSNKKKNDNKIIKMVVSTNRQRS